MLVREILALRMILFENNLEDEDIQLVLSLSLSLSLSLLCLPLLF